MNEYQVLIASLVASLVIYITGEVLRRYLKAKYEARLKSEEIAILKYLGRHGVCTEETMIANEVRLSDQAVRYALARLYFGSDVKIERVDENNIYAGIGWKITTKGGERIK